MFITLKMMQSLDGSIAQKVDDNLSWGSKEDKQNFKKIRLENQIMIIGSTTFEQTPKKFLTSQPLVVVTRNIQKYQMENPKYQEYKWFFMEPNAVEIIEFLESQKYKKVLLAGGGVTNNMFLQAGLVNEIQLTIAPFLFNSKITTFGSIPIPNIDLELQSFLTLGKNELLLTYKVGEKKME
jgi:dihydrofolate reductase